MHPLGMNYNVTCKGNPYNSGGRDTLLRIRGDRPKSYFTRDKFETTIQERTSNFKILFLTRL